MKPSGRVTNAEGPGARVEPMTDAAAEPGVLVLKITGEVDLASVASLRPHIEQSLDPMPTMVVFDLSGLQFMDSSGMALLLTVAQRVGNVEVRNPTPIIRRVIELSGLSGALRIVP